MMGLVLSANMSFAAIDHVANPEVILTNNSEDYALRCYGAPIRQGDVGDMYDNMSWVQVGSNDTARGKLLHAKTDTYDYVSSNVTIYAHYQDDDEVNTYNVSWAVCYIYQTVTLNCEDPDTYQEKNIDITYKTTANAYPYSDDDSEVGGPDPNIFYVPAQDYDDWPQKPRYDSPIAVIEIGITPMSGVFYNTMPVYNVGSPYASLNEDGTPTYHYDYLTKNSSCQAESYDDGYTKTQVSDASKIDFCLAHDTSHSDVVGTYNDQLYLNFKDGCSGSS